MPCARMHKWGTDSSGNRMTHGRRDGRATFTGMQRLGKQRRLGKPEYQAGRLTTRGPGIEEIAAEKYRDEAVREEKR